MGRDQHTGTDISGQRHQEIQDSAGVGAVEGTGRFIGQHKSRAVDQSTRNSHPLRLSTTDLTREPRSKLAQPDAGQHLLCLGNRNSTTPAREFRRQRNVVAQGQFADKFAELEDQADRRPTHGRSPVPRET